MVRNVNMKTGRIQVIENALSEDTISFIMEQSKEEEFHAGQVGARVNLKQKIRKDLFLKDPSTLGTVDNVIYDSLYTKVQEDFGVDIKYREPWKIGYYNSEDGGFYNLHTDDARETKYRSISMVCALSDPDDYEGGVLHFPDLKREFKLKKGSIIVFDSFLMHGVTPVTNGKRFVMIGFFFTHEGRTVKEHIMKIPEKNKTWIDTYKPILKNIRIDYPEEKIPLKMGDEDYSDINEHPWTNQDDYLFERNESKTLFISFAGMGWRDSIPTFNFYNFMKKYNDVDKLFLRDTGPPGSKVWCCRYYLLGLRHTCKGYEKTIEKLRSLTTQYKYDKIVAFGCSAGGFAAMLYAQQLGFDVTIAFNPQTTLLPNKREEFGDKYNAPENATFLSKLRKDSEEYQKALDLSNFMPFKNKTIIHYSKESNGCADKKHAEHIKSENCHLIEHDSANHLLALELKQSGKLKDIIDDALYRSEETCGLEEANTSVELD